MSPIEAGLLTHELLLQQPTGDEEAYADVDTVWGNIRLATGGEVLRFGGPQATAAYVVTIYYRDDVRASWRVVDVDASPTRALQISSYGDPDGVREQLHLFCVEVQ